MIARLKGCVDLLDLGSVILDVGGVGYQVFCSSRTLAKLTLGEKVVLEIETQVREDHIHLFGFFDGLERDWFKLLTMVQGVGAKVGLAILSMFEPHELNDILASEDKMAIAQANGVGPKLATRIISELKDKRDVLSAVNQSYNVNKSDTPILEKDDNKSKKDAISGLVNLGFSSMESFSTVSRIVANSQKEISVEDLIRLGLRELSSDLSD